MAKESAKFIREVFQIQTLTPEEYAGRYSHRIITLGYRFEDHEDPELESWLNQLREILNDESALATAHKKFLSPSELDIIEQEAKIDWWDLLGD